MAKNMRRLLALVIALALTAGQIAVPAMATEAEELDSVSEVTVTQIENGTETVTVTIDAASGTQTTKTEVSTNDTEAGTSTESTRTDTVTTNPAGTQTDTSSNWESKEVQTGSDTQTVDNTTVQTDTNITTTVEGTETSEQTITQDQTTGIETHEGKLEGEETTIIDDTTVTTETTKDVLLEQETITDAPVTNELESSEEKTEGQWNEGQENVEQWQEVSEGEPTLKDQDTETTSSGNVTPESQGATLVLSPNEEVVTAKEVITLKDVLAGTQQKPESNETQTVEELKDEKGNLIGWKITQKTETVGTSTTQEPVITGDWKETSTTTTVKDSGKYTEGTTTEGNVTTTVEKIYDEKTNEFLGYRVTKVTVTESDNSADPVITESSRDTETIKGTAQDNGFTLPEKPAESVVTNEYGDTTTVTVTDLMEDGKHIGYTISTVITSADGTAIRKETKNIYGTASTLTTDEVRDPVTEKTVTTTKITTTEVEEIYETEETRTLERTDTKVTDTTTTYLDETDTYQLVETDAGMFFLYKGVMYAVTGSSVIKNSYDVATGDTVSMTGYTDADDVRVKGESVLDENGNKLTVTDYYTGQTSKDDGNVADGSWRHVGYGLYSDFVLKDSNGKAHSAMQFKIKDGNEIRYVYCVELGTKVSEGTYYSPETYTDDEDNNVAPWESDNGDATGTVQQLRSVALNGFWGTESGLGSLDAVKELMRRNGLSKEADRLTVGMAVAATQAAVWEFAALDPDGKSEAPKFRGDFLTYDDEAGKAPSAEDKAAIVGLRNLLVELAKDSGEGGSGAAEAITKESITGAVIKVEDKVTDDSGNVQKDEKGNTLYNAGLSFKMEVSTSSLNGDLVLEITDANGREIGKYRLAGEDKPNVLDYVTTRIRPDSNGMYTIENVQLAENVKINLNLKGIQHLDDGVYIYTNSEKQDFIGLSRKENHVDLEVDLQFEVQDPTINHTNTKTTSEYSVLKTESRSVTRTDTRDVTRIAKSGTEKIEKTHDVEVYGTVTVTRTRTDITKEDRNWESNYQYQLQLINDEDGNGGNGGNDGGNENGIDNGNGLVILDENDIDNGVTILDEEVPLAKAPKTGDISLLWVALSSLSAGGLAMLNRKRKDEE